MYVFRACFRNGNDHSSIAWHVLFVVAAFQFFVFLQGDTILSCELNVSCIAATKLAAHHMERWLVYSIFLLKKNKRRGRQNETIILYKTYRTEHKYTYICTMHMCIRIHCIMNSTVIILMEHWNHWQFYLAKYRFGLGLVYIMIPSTLYSKMLAQSMKCIRLIKNEQKLC